MNDSGGKINVTLGKNRDIKKFFGQHNDYFTAKFLEDAEDERRRHDAAHDLAPSMTVCQNCPARSVATPAQDLHKIEIDAVPATS